ncbi:MAG: hypothetical protein HPY63_08365 [Methanobacteriaceae archaeon]|nr:hypothetical protein [Methanobacteriaceae archaeon]
MKIKNIEFLKKNLQFLSHLSRDHLYIISDNNGEIHFLNTNKERTIIADFSLSDIDNIKKLSFKVGNLFYDIFSRIERGSDVYLNFNKDKLVCDVRYENIEFKSIFNYQKADFQGFPEYTADNTFKISGEKLYHGLNLLAKFKSDLKLKTKQDELIINAKNENGSLELKIPSDMELKDNKVTESIYDYEIIKHLLRPSKISKKVDLNLSWNEKINDNLLVVEFHFKNFEDTIKYLFTPKGDLVEPS